MLLEDRCPNLLGYSVPRVLLRTDVSSLELSLDHHYDLVLVTEYVGKGLKRTHGGILYMTEGKDIVRVGALEEAHICAAAVRSLAYMHENSIVHGDVALRNLRVKREEETNPGASTDFWRAWWIDLGKATHLSKENESSYLFTLEMEECYSLFRREAQV